MLKQVAAGVLNLAYLEAGTATGPPVVLLHGFPYDVHAYDDVTPILTVSGCRVVTPYLRGDGPTRFRSPDTPRSGQQAALGSDLLALMDTLAIERAVLAGYDWGGRAACIVAALWPERVRGLVSGGHDGYNIQDIAGSIHPQKPEYELRYWYQFYSIPNAAAPAWPGTATLFANCCGSCGVPTGGSTTPLTTGLPRPSRIRISSMS